MSTHVIRSNVGFFEFSVGGGADESPVHIDIVLPSPDELSQWNNFRIVSMNEQLSDLLCSAAGEGNTEEINKLVKYIRRELSPNPNDFALENELGTSPFHTAVVNNQVDSIQTLIDAGFDVNVMSLSDCNFTHHSNSEVMVPEGTTPLELAVQLNQIALAKLFIKHGATIKKELIPSIQKLFKRETACVKESTELPRELAEKVTAYAFLPDIEDPNIPICVNCAPKNNSEILDFMKNTTNLRKFTNFKTDNPNYQLTDGDEFIGLTALHLTAMLANNYLLGKIIDMGGAEVIDLGSDFGVTPLHTAVAAGNIQGAEILLRSGANVNLATRRAHINRFPRKATPLWTALECRRNLPLIKLLLQYGALVDLPLSERGNRLLEQAKKELAEEE